MLFLIFAGCNQNTDLKTDIYRFEDYASDEVFDIEKVDLSKDLAEKAGISPATLAKMKKDGATVSSDVLVKICTALECTMDDIVEIVSLD